MDDNIATIEPGLKAQCHEIDKDGQNSPDLKKDINSHLPPFNPDARMNSLGGLELDINSIEHQVNSINPMRNNTTPELLFSYIRILKLQLELSALKQEIQDYRMMRIKRILAKTQSQLDKYKCVICLAEEKTCLLEPCSHLVCCENCIASIQGTSCPICRTRCDYYLKVYNA
jgi:hypothetical protein